MTSRHRKVAGGIAALSLAAGLVLAGSMAATADDGLYFAAEFDNATLAYADRTVNFSGTAVDPTSDVQVYLDGEIELCSGPVTAGTWSCTTPANVALPVGEHNYTALQDLELGQIYDVVTITVLLPTPTVTAPTTVPAAGTVSLEGGQAVAGATISAVVTTPNEPGLTCSTGPLTGDGAWSGCNIPFDEEIPPGSNATVTVTQSMPGSTSTTTTHTFSVAPFPPGTVTIDNPTDGQVYTWDAGTFATISGRAPVGIPVDIQVDGTPIAACTGLPVDAFGNWSCGSRNLAIGSDTVTAVQGVESDTSNIEVWAPAPDVGGLPLQTTADNDAYAVGGTYGLPGYQVYVSLAWEGEDYRECSSAVTAGNWSCVLDLYDIPAGTYDVDFVQRPFPDDPTVQSIVATYALVISYPPAPDLACSFSPNGGFSASSAYEMDDFELNRIYLEGGSPGSDNFGFPGTCNGSFGSPFPDSDDVYLDTIEYCSPTCAQSGLTPGPYEVYYAADGESEAPSFAGHSYLFTIPEAPVITTAESSANSVELSGTAEPGDTVRIERGDGSALCTTTATGGGTWACPFVKSTAATAFAIAIDPSGGMSAYSAPEDIPIFVAPVTPPTTPTTPTTPDPPAPNLVSWLLNFDGDLSNLKPGDVFTINVSGMPVGTEIEVWMHSTPRLLGTATGTGAPMSMDLVVPMDIENGPHEIEMIAVTPLGTNYFFTSDAMVSGGVDPAPVDDPETPQDETAGDGTGTGNGSSNRADPAAPSALTDSIATLERIGANPVAIAVAGGLALALMILVALPTELLNNALSSNTSRLGRAYGVVDRAFTRAQDWFLKVTRSRALAAALIVALVALIYGFVDPNFGFDIVSLRLVLSLALAFFILSYGASWLSGFVTRRLWGVTNVIVLQPSILLFAVLGVILARILDFSPGFLVGIAIGLELIAASKRVAARVVMVQFGFVVGLALVAWVVYSLFTPGPDFLGMLTEDMLVAITAEGLTGALIAIFPLQFLDGRELWEDSKLRWSITFLIVATAFALLVLPTALEGTDVGDYGTWVVVLAVFGAVSLGAWFFFARAARKEELAERSKVDA